MKITGKFFYKIIFVFLIQIIMISGCAEFCPVFAKDTDTLSPGLMIQEVDFKNILNYATFSKTDTVKLFSLRLNVDKLASKIYREVGAGNFSSLYLFWQDKDYDYQEFIKRAAAINAVIDRILQGNMFENYNSFKNLDEFLLKLINIRLEMFKHYQVPLSKKGEKKISLIKEKLSQAKTKEMFKILRKLAYPDKNWFVKLLTQEKIRYLNKNKIKYINVLATSGCSTQCDHCFLPGLVKVNAMPWVWINELNKKRLLSAKIKAKFRLDIYKNDILRDYYDFIFDRDASDVLKSFDESRLITSGFNIGSVGMRALRKLLERSSLTEMNISVAPNLWMRRIGLDNYIESIYEIAYRVKSGIKDDQSPNILFYPFNNSADAPELNSENIRRRISEKLKSIKIKILDQELVDMGRFHQLRTAGIIKYDGPELPNTEFLDENAEKFFLQADGSLLQGIKHNPLNPPYAEYKHILGFKAIAKQPIKCRHCRLLCPGDGQISCIGSKALINTLKPLQIIELKELKNNLIKQSI